MDEDLQWQYNQLRAAQELAFAGYKRMRQNYRADETPCLAWLATQNALSVGIDDILERIEEEATMPLFGAKIDADGFVRGWDV